MQTCIIHLLRNTFKYAARQYWYEIARDIKPVYTAPSAEAAEARFEEFADKWGHKYTAVIKLWRTAWVANRIKRLPDNTMFSTNSRNRSPRIIQKATAQ